MIYTNLTAAERLNINNAAFITVLYRKTDGRLVDLDIRQFSIEPKATLENLTTFVTIPDGERQPSTKSEFICGSAWQPHIQLQVCCRLILTERQVRNKVLNYENQHFRKFTAFIQKMISSILKLQEEKEKVYKTSLCGRKIYKERKVVMFKKWVSAFSVIVMIAALFAGIHPVMAEEAEKGISWMCIGDSITYGNKVPGGYRAILYDLYKKGGINLNMVGPNSANNGEGLLPAGSGHAGYGGYYIREISNKIVSWLESYQPQVVSLQIGTNDMLMNKTDKFPDDTRDTAPDRLSELIDKITEALPETEVFVAKIPPLNSAGYNPHVVKYNESVETVVSSKGGKVHLVDNYTALNDDKAANLQDDGIHPNLTGYQKMAQSWYNASQSIVSQLTPAEPLRLLSTSRTGKYLLHLNSSGTESYKNASAEAVVETNTEYQASFYVKGDTGVTVMGRTVGVLADGAWASTPLKNVSFECGPNWAKGTFQFNSGDYTKVRLVFMDNSKTAGNVYIDDCSVMKVGSEAELLKNPGFEAQSSNWDAKAPFAVIQSLDVLNPPSGADSGEKGIAKTVSITMDTFTDKGVPTDISCQQFPAGKYYTAPDKMTANFITKNSEIFYKGSDNKGNIMINSNGKELPSRFGLDKEGYNAVTGFDEVHLKFKIVQVTGVTYTEPKNYPLKIRISDFNATAASKAGAITGSTLKNSKQLSIIPSKFSTLDDEYEEVVFKRSDFAGDALNLEGELKAYKDNAGDEHMMLLSFWPASRTGYLIDEINFIWYDNEPTANITEMNFTKNGENINAYGLKNGENFLTASLYNPTTADLENAQFILTLVNKTDGRMEELDAQAISLTGKETKSDVSLSVTIPENANPKDYEARVMIFRGFDSLKPILSSAYRFDGNGEVKN